MALSIEQQRRYARMLTPEQLANYVKNPDMGNEIGITPSVFAEAIAEINAEDQEPQPAAPNTVIDREVNEMLGGRSQGLGGFTPQEPMNPGMMPQQFSHGGMIPGYQVGGHLGPTTPSNDFLQMVLNQPEIKNAMTKTSAKGGLPRLVGQVFNKYNPYAYYLLAMLGLPEEIGYSDEDREAFLRRPDYPMLKKIREVGVGNLKGMEDSEWARKAGGYSTGHDDQGMDFDKPSIWERIKEMYQGPIGRASGGIIPGYENGGDVNPDKPLSTRELYEQRQKEIGQAQGYSDTPEVTPSWMEEASGGMPQPTREDANKLLGILTGMPIDLGGQWGLFEEGTTGRELGQDALQQAVLTLLGIKGAKMGWSLGKGALGKGADLLTRPVRGILERDKSSWLQSLLEQTTRMTSGPQGGNLFPIGTRFPAPSYRTPISTVGQSLRALPVTTGIGGAGILGGHELLNKWTGFDLFSGEPGDITLGPIGATPPPDQGDRKKDDIDAGKKVSAEQEMREALGLGDLPVDVPAGGSGIDQMISSIQGRIDAGANKEEKDLLTALQGRTAITDRISELEGSREGDHEEYLQNRFYNALANIARPGGVGASLSASDSAYSREQDDLENILADLKMQGEGQDIETARVTADLSRRGEEHLPSLYDAQLAKWQEAVAMARSDSEKEFAVRELALRLAASATPTAEVALDKVNAIIKILESPDSFGLNMESEQLLSEHLNYALIEAGMLQGRTAEQEEQEDY